MQLRSVTYILLLCVAYHTTGCTVLHKTRNPNLPATTIAAPDKLPEANTASTGIPDSNNSISQMVQKYLFAQQQLANAHVGIAIFHPKTNRFWYQHQSNKYFTPASNTKIFTCYAALQYLGDSLVALQYTPGSTVHAQAMGDPTFLHPLFAYQPLYAFLQKNTNIKLSNTNWQCEALGKGWAWDDYRNDFMPERSILPVYGNVANLQIVNKQLRCIPSLPLAAADSSATFLPSEMHLYKFYRQLHQNQLLWQKNNKPFTATTLPFITSLANSVAFLQDTLPNTRFSITSSSGTYSHRLHSQPTDTLLKIMMHQSDNFLAEQTLLMISQQALGYMNDDAIIKHLLNTTFSGLPQATKWIDGSGLSRYNLTTPENFIWVLQQQLNNISWKRITSIYPSGNSGTLKNYYTPFAKNIYAKTGTLNNQVSLCGYLITEKKETLLFSILVNNHVGTATAIRRAIETLLTTIIKTY